MGNRKTISQRFYRWFEIEPLWATLALSSFALAMAGLVLHLGGGYFVTLIGMLPEFVGWVRTIGLVMLIAFDVALLAITGLRKQYWWFSFFIYITVGVLGWEVASYFFGS